MPAEPSTHLPVLSRLHLIYKVLFAAAIACSVVIFIPIDINRLERIILGWDMFCVVLLFFYWWSFFKTPQARVKQQVIQEDPSRTVIFLLLLVCSTASITIVILLLTSTMSGATEKAWKIPLAMSGMVLTWFLIHTVFTVRYAKMYYIHKYKHPDSAEVLEFPETKDPDFIDFAYFSFVLGMTFQVSDISIHSKKVRKWVLLHSLISFAYNAIIIALSINVIAGLSS